jgi:hypothetical protein
MNSTELFFRWGDSSESESKSFIFDSHGLIAFNR